MNAYQEIAALRREVQGWIREAAARVVRWSRVSSASATGDEDGVEGPDPSNGEQRVQDRARRVAPWGIAGRPMVGVAGAILRASAGAAQNILVGIASAKYGRQDLKAGETQVYNKVAGCEIFLDENGTLQINVPNGQNVVVNNGTLKVACHGDSTAGHTHPPGTLTGTIVGTANLTTGAVTGTCTITGGTTGNSTDTINVTVGRRFKA